MATDIDVLTAGTVRTAQPPLIIDQLERPGRRLMLRPPLVLTPIVARDGTDGREVWEVDDRALGLHALGRSRAEVLRAVTATLWRHWDTMRMQRIGLVDGQLSPLLQRVAPALCRRVSEQRILLA